MTNFFHHAKLFKCQSNKNGVPPPKALPYPRGISKQRKENILTKLLEVIPSNRCVFWETLRESRIDFISENDSIEKEL